MLVVNPKPWSFFETHFTTPRLRHYLIASSANQTQAMQLYEWNNDISAAFWQSFGYVEVALRNTIDRQLTARHKSKGRDGHWIFDDAKELGRDRDAPGKHGYPYSDISAAIERVKQNGMNVNAGQIVSEMPFGFWHQIVSKKHKFLWPDLASGFPNMSGRDQEQVSILVSSLRGMRNRICHHHRIWAIDISANYDGLLKLAHYIDTDLEQWIRRNSRVNQVLSYRPLIS